MDIAECIIERTSIRDFKPDPIEDEVIEEALRLANLAPSAGNLQARDFVIVKDAHRKKALAEAAYSQDYVRTAPVVIACCVNLERIAHYGSRGRTLYCIQDSAAAIENMILYLQSKGLGTVWVGAFDEKRVSEALELPAHARPVALVPVGYPKEKGVRRKRLPMEQYVHRDKW